MKLLAMRFKWFLIALVFFLAISACEGKGLNNHTFSAEEFVSQSVSRYLEQALILDLVKGRTRNHCLVSWSNNYLFDSGKFILKLRNVSIPSDFHLSADLSNRSLAEFQKLSKKGHSEFDSAFSQLLCREIEEQIVDFEKEAMRNPEKKIKQLAFSSLPFLQKYSDELKLFRLGTFRCDSLRKRKD